eukprot:jgi/Mesvir1/19568/Mv04957-RA.1
MDQTARLAHCICDESIRPEWSHYAAGSDRETLDDKDERPQFFDALANLFCDTSYQPKAEQFGECGMKLPIDPSKPQHTAGRTAKYIKDKYNEIRSEVSVAASNYERSGQNNPNRADYVNNNGVLYFWLYLVKYGMMEAVLRTVDGEVAFEDAVGGVSGSTKPASKKAIRGLKRYINPGSASGTSNNPVKVEDTPATDGGQDAAGSYFAAKEKMLAREQAKLAAADVETAAKSAAEAKKIKIEILNDTLEKWSCEPDIAAMARKKLLETLESL